MTSENESSAAAPESPAVETVVEQQQEPVVEQPTKKDEPKPAPKVKGTQPMPDHAPLPGTKYVLNPATGMYDVVRDAPAEVEVEEKDDDSEQEAAPTGAVDLVIPEEVQRQGALGEDDRVLLSEASEMMSAAGYTAEQQNRLVDIYALESMAHTEAPRAETHGQEAVLGYLREHWGSEFDARLEAAQAMTKKIGAKFERWLGETGLGDDPTMLSVLANVGRGLLSISKADAQKQIAELRKNFKPYEKDSKLTVAKLRVLADRVARGEPNPEDARLKMGAAFQKGVVSQIDGPASLASEPSRQAKDVIGTLREQQAATMKEFGRHSPQYRAISAKITAAYERAYPGEHRA